MRDTDEQQAFLIDLLRRAEVQHRKAELDSEDARRRVERAAQEMAGIRLAIGFHRSEHNLPHEPIPDAAIQDEYASFGPTEMVERWADAHDGLFVVKDAARAMRDNGMYRTYRDAYNTLRQTVERKRAKGVFEKVATGVFRRRQLSIPVVLVQ